VAAAAPVGEADWARTVVLVAPRAVEWPQEGREAKEAAVARAGAEAAEPADLPTPSSITAQHRPSKGRPPSHPGQAVRRVLGGKRLVAPQPPTAPTAKLRSGNRFSDRFGDP
jgi:hypothetical protein